MLYTYDLASRIAAITDQVSGTLDPSITVNLGPVVRESRTYYAGGLLATLADGKGSKLIFIYDGFKRRSEVHYPDDTPSTPDFDLRAFDANGNEVMLRRRSNSSAEIWSTYDALNRRISKAPTGQATITYGYDYTGRLLTALADTDGGVAHQISYDTAGRPIGEFTPQFGWITATLDANGNRTSLTWPATATYTASYAYDELNRLTGVFEDPIETGIRIAGYGYNTLSQRSGVAYGPATGPVASTGLTWTPAGRVASLAHSWNGSGLTLTYGYNQDQQRTGLTASDATFLPAGLGSGSATYTTNNLNQYTSVSSTPYTYDKNGNLASDGVWTFGYDTGAPWS